MSCGFNRSCIEKHIRSYFDQIDQEGFVQAEKRIAAATGRASDGVFDKVDISYIARASGATSGSGFVHRHVVSGIMDALDKNHDGGISLREFTHR